MFDPTVFDNLKVVIEGYIYDLDLEGKINVIGRSDIVDLASMVRKYLITIEDVRKSKRSILIEMEIPHRELSGELLETNEKPGCYVTVTFCENNGTHEYDELLLKKLKRSWGKQHFVKLFLTKEITDLSVKYHHKYIVEFQTLFGEDSIDDLINILDHSISLLGLNSKR